MKKIVILGSTGSIGTQTLEIVDEQKDIKVLGLSAGSNVDLLEFQIRKYRPVIAAIWSEEDAKSLKIKVQDFPVKIVSGMEGLIEVATITESQLVITAVVGMIGIRPTIAAIKAKKHIGLANKETLVTAGHIIMPLAKQNGISIYPVDSEHSAIYQALQGEQKDQLQKIILTASGGPFRGKSIDELATIQVEDALKHPNWVMGKKITIDSSTLVNKGLEVMEAKWLFSVNLAQIQVVIHPQSVIHSMVEFVDGGIIAQLGTPDMKLPIQYAIYEGERKYLGGERLDFAKLGSITFEEPDTKTFSGLQLAYRAGNTGGTMPTVYNAANELAVSKFLSHKIKYLEIVEIIESCMNLHDCLEYPTVDDILEVEKQTYELIESRW